MTAPSVRSYSAWNSTSGNSSHDVPQPDTPSGPATDDVIYLFFATDPDTTITQPTGFTTFYDNIQPTGVGESLTGEAAYKVWASGDPANYTVTQATSERSVAVLLAVQGDGGIDVQSTVADGSAGPVTFNGITTTVNDCLIVAVAMCDKTEASPLGTPSGYTKVAEATNTSAATVGVYTKVLATAGSETPGNVTQTLDQEWVSFVFAIAPAGGAAAYTLTAAQGSFTLTGQATAFKAARQLAAAQGAYTLTGQAAFLSKGYILAAAQGAYALTGQAVNLVTARILSAVQGAYTLTGQTAIFVKNYPLTAASGAYTLTGQAAGLVADRVLTAAQGSYTLTGQAAGLLKGFIMTAAYGAYTLTGQATALKAARKLTAAYGAYTLTGYDAILTGASTYILNAAAGAYTLTGQAAGLVAGRVLTAAQGAYTLTGQSVNFYLPTAASFARKLFVLRDDRNTIVGKESRTANISKSNRDNEVGII